MHNIGMKHFFTIDRNNDSAFVQIYEIDATGGEYVPGKLVAAYETASKGATSSARKQIRKIEAR